MTIPAIEELRLQSARVAGHAELRDIRTFSLSAELTRLPNEGRQLAFNLEPVVEADRISEDAFSVNAFFRLDVIEVDDQEAERSEEAEVEDVPLLSEIKFKIAGLYTLRELDDPEADALSDDELTSFAQSTGLLALYPYARALVSDLTGRIGLPTLTLPMIKIDIGDEMANEATLQASDTSRTEST